MDVENDVVSLIWARRPLSEEFCNFGDALSPIVTALVSGKCVRPYKPEDKNTISAIGTIGHSIEQLISKRTTAWIWGTGIDASIDPRGERQYFNVYKRNLIKPLVTRGAFTEMLLKHNGVETTGIYGDPAWVIRRVMCNNVKKSHDIGIVLHLSELENANTLSNAHLKKYVRYQLEPGASIKIISTIAKRSVQGVLEKINEIRSCRIVLSVSLHGMIIAEAFGIPCAHFHFLGKRGLDKAPIFGFDSDRPIDHRFRDFYSGIKRRNYVLCYRWPRVERLDYSNVLDEILASWEPSEYDDSDMIGAFPGTTSTFFPQASLDSLDNLVKSI